MRKRTENPYKRHPVLGKRPKKPLTHQEVCDVMMALCEAHGITEPEKDPLAFGKLAFHLAHLFVPALRPENRRGRPRQYSVRDIMWTRLEFGRVRQETGLSAVAAIIEHMAEDTEFWRDMELGETKNEIYEALRYILTDRIKQPEIAHAVEKEFLDLVAALDDLKKSPH